MVDRQYTGNIVIPGVDIPLAESSSDVIIVLHNTVWNISEIIGYFGTDGSTTISEKVSQYLFQQKDNPISTNILGKSIAEPTSEMIPYSEHTRGLPKNVHSTIQILEFTVYNSLTNTRTDYTASSIPEPIILQFNDVALIGDYPVVICDSNGEVLKFDVILHISQSDAYFYSSMALPYTDLNMYIVLTETSKCILLQDDALFD